MLDTTTFQDTVARALAEDIRTGDVTSEATVAADQRAAARITQKAPGVVFGLDLAEEVFRQVDDELSVTRTGPEGVWREHGPVLEITGSARSILAGERTALNFLQRLSGVATLTHRYVEAIDGTGARVLDTRKTTPGLRTLEKAAVAAGGGVNHRVGLFDEILIKENHAAMAGGVGAAVTRAAAYRPGMTLVVEAENLDEVSQALEAWAQAQDAGDAPAGTRFRILLDNMTTAQLTDAVTKIAGAAETEASGRYTLENIRTAAETGVDFISVGALTHSAPGLDLSLLLEPLS